MSGFAILTLLIFRLLWALVGSSTARFANFVRGPGAVRDYLRDNSSWRFAGQSARALSVVALLAAIAARSGSACLGRRGRLNEGPLAQLVSLETSEAARDFHEQWLGVVLALIALHVGAIIYYRLAQGRKLTWPMITGRAAFEAGVAPMRPAKGWVAVVCLVAALAVARWIVAGAPPFGP